MGPGVENLSTLNDSVIVWSSSNMTGRVGTAPLFAEAGPALDLNTTKAGDFIFDGCFFTYRNSGWRASCQGYENGSIASPYQIPTPGSGFVYCLPVSASRFACAHTEDVSPRYYVFARGNPGPLFETAAGVLTTKLRVLGTIGRYAAFEDTSHTIIFLNTLTGVPEVIPAGDGLSSIPYFTLSSVGIYGVLARTGRAYDPTCDRVFLVRENPFRFGELFQLQPTPYWSALVGEFSATTTSIWNVGMIAHERRVLVEASDLTGKRTVFVSRPWPCFDDYDCLSGRGCSATTHFCDIRLSPTGPPDQSPVQSPARPPALVPLPIPRAAPPSNDGSCAGVGPINSYCDNGVWVVNSTVIVNATIVVGGPVVIRGNFSVSSPNATVIIVFAKPPTSSEPVVSVQGCATFQGLLNVSIPSSFNITNTVQLVAYNGYCSGVPTRFDQFLVDLGCRKASSTSLEYNDRSLSLVFSDLDESECNRGVVTQSLSLSTAAIAGIAVGATFLVVAVLIGVGIGCRHRLVPAFRLGTQSRSLRAKLGTSL